MPLPRAAVSLLPLAAGCDSAASAGAPQASAPPQGASGGGCAGTPARIGGRPAWAPDPADLRTPYVLASPPTAVAILPQPLRAGHPSNPSNKVAFGVRSPRAGTPLQIDAQPVAGGTPAVHAQAPADVVGSGEIYITTLDLPTPGCWRLTLRWGAPRVTTTLFVQVGVAKED